VCQRLAVDTRSSGDDALEELVTLDDDGARVRGQDARPRRVLSACAESARAALRAALAFERT
jgi:hypothetical protein